MLDDQARMAEYDSNVVSASTTSLPGCPMASSRIEQLDSTDPGAGMPRLHALQRSDRPS